MGSPAEMISAGLPCLGQLPIHTALKEDPPVPYFSFLWDNEEG